MPQMLDGRGDGTLGDPKSPRWTLIAAMIDLLNHGRIPRAFMYIPGVVEHIGTISQLEVLGEAANVFAGCIESAQQALIKLLTHTEIVPEDMLPDLAYLSTVHLVRMLDHLHAGEQADDHVLPIALPSFRQTIEDSVRQGKIEPPPNPEWSNVADQHAHDLYRERGITELIHALSSSIPGAMKQSPDDCFFTLGRHLARLARVVN